MTSLVSINILTWNGRKFIKDCLDSFFLQTYKPIEILIADNNSTDGTVEFIEQNYPNIKLIKNTKNVGFSAGHNELFKQSKGEFILCANQDTILDKKLIENAVKVFQQDSKIGAIQPKIFQLEETNGGYQKSKIIDTTGLLILKSRQVVNRGQGKEDQGQFDRKKEIFGVDGALAFFRRAALEDIKISKPNQSESYEFFDENFFAYKEDIDLAWRLRWAGWNAVYVPESIGWHARTIGKKAATSSWKMIKEYREKSSFVKYLSFKNHRLAQIKNENPSLFFKHLPWILPRELGSWIYILLFEKYRWKAIKDLFNQVPLALQKRKIIMAQRKINLNEINKWFI